MDADGFFTVCKDSETSYCRLWEVLDHALNDSFLDRLTSLLGQCHDVGNHGADTDVSSWFEEIVNRSGRYAPAIGYFEKTRVLTNQQSSTAGTLRVFSTGFKIVLCVVREDDDTNAIIFLARASSPVECRVECIDCTDARKGHVDNVTVPEAVFAKSVLIPLCKHIENVGCCWLCSVKSGFCSEIHPANVSRVDTVPVDQLHNRHGAHRCRIFVDIRNSHSFQTESFVQLSIVCSAHFCEVTHVHVQAWKVNRNIINPNVDHAYPAILAYLYAGSSLSTHKSTYRRSGAVPSRLA